MSDRQWMMQCRAAVVLVLILKTTFYTATSALLSTLQSFDYCWSKESESYHQELHKQLANQHSSKLSCYPIQTSVKVKWPIIIKDQVS